MASTTKKEKATVSPERIKEAFMEFVLLEGRLPTSVFAFVRQLGIDEVSFYQHFNSFQILERAIWADWLRETLDMLQKDEQYAIYSSREKLLAFYFSWVQQLLANRSYVLLKFGHLDRKELNPTFLMDLRVNFENFIDELIMQGKETGEVADRPAPLTGQYKKAFWLHFLFIVRHWSLDETKDFEKTDVAIEKSVNLAYDLIGRGPLESILDFGKFLYQNQSRA